MKIIQSFWSAQKDISTYSFGWLDAKYHLLSWILSSHQLKKHYDDVELVTDQAGYEILINRLKLPYTKVHVILDKLNKFDDKLWALAKIKAYSIQDEPFLHVDGDVFIWDKIDMGINNYDIIVQNEELITPYYDEMWSKVYPHLNCLPIVMRNYIEGVDRGAYNMGIFGASNLEFIKQYVNNSFEFVDSNIGFISSINDLNFNIFFEQVLLYQMAKECQLDVKYYIKENIGNNEYRDFGNFDKVPYDRKYLHLLGFFKKQPVVCKKLETYVMKYYPESYLRFMDSFKKPSFGKQKLIENNENSLLCLSQSYLLKLLKGHFLEKKHSNYHDLIGRDILLEGNVTQFSQFILLNVNFYIIPTSGFKFICKDNESYIQINNHSDLSIIVQSLEIDAIIFDVCKGYVQYSEFKILCLEYLGDDIPKELYKDFLKLIDDRVSYLISLGILFASIYPIKIGSVNH
jgi:hypothetical protein